MAKLHHPHAGLLLVRNQTQMMIPLSKDVTTIGRKQADIILDDPKVSSTHAEIHRNSQGFVLIDRKSTNGTYVNRQPITQVILADQDIIELGVTTLCFFLDRREFNGVVQEQPLSGVSKPKVDPANAFRTDSITTTRTVQQCQIEIKIVEGQQKGKSFRFRKSHITLGRSDADVVIMDLDVSRNHALIEVLGKASVFIRDLGSTNGTFVNSKRVQSEKLQSGDSITIGNSKMKIEIESLGDQS